MNDFCIDANVFITAWNEHYRLGTFPSLWAKLVENKNNFTIIKPIFDEIDPGSSGGEKILAEEFKKDYSVRHWIESNNFKIVEIEDKDEMLGIALEKEYEAKKYSSGVGEVDLQLIAYAKNRGKTIVTYESLQIDPPKEKYNYKIPRVCKDQGVECITCIDFLEKLSIRI